MAAPGNTAWPSHPCPGCGRPLPASGEVTVEGATFPVYQCSHCTRPFPWGGQTFDAALTFAVGADGKPFDPGDAC